MTEPIANHILPNILVVDDTPDNLNLLVGMFKDHGYRIRPVPSGALALRAASAEPPDLILLDIGMPEMDGYEVCKQLKTDPLLRDIPVIFLTARTEVEDRVKAFAVGGVDYVTKPFQFPEINARVRAHLELRRQRREIEENYKKLSRLEALRDSLVHMLVHDLRSPLGALVGFLDYLKIDSTSLNGEQQKNIEKAQNIAKRIVLMVTSVLDVNQLEAEKMIVKPSECDARAVAREVIESLSSMTEGRSLSLAQPQEKLPAVMDKGLISRVLQNLISNALKFTPREGGAIEVQAALVEDRIQFKIKDNGTGIPSEHQTAIFEKFGQVDGSLSGKKYSTGLGLAFCKLAVEAHGGLIGVESAAGKGSTFWFTLPQKGLK